MKNNNKIKLETDKEEFGIISVYPTLLSEFPSKKFIESYYFSRNSMCLNSGQTKFQIEIKYSSDAYLVYSWLLKNGWRYLKLYSSNSTDHKKISIKEYNNSDFNLASWIEPLSIIEIVICKKEFYKFQEDLQRMSHETGLLNLYRNYREEDGRYMKRWKYVLK